MFRLFPEKEKLFCVYFLSWLRREKGKDLRRQLLLAPFRLSYLQDMLKNTPNEHKKPLSSRGAENNVRQH